MSGKDIVATRLRLSEPASKLIRQGSRGEVTYDFEFNTLRLYNQDQPGGYTLLRSDLTNLPTNITLGTVTVQNTITANVIIPTGGQLTVNNANGVAGTINDTPLSFEIKSTPNVTRVAVRNSLNTAKVYVYENGTINLESNSSTAITANGINFTSSGNFSLTAPEKIVIQGISIEGTELDTTDSSELRILAETHHFGKVRFEDELIIHNTIVPQVPNINIGTEIKRFNNLYLGTTGSVRIGGLLLTREAGTGQLVSSDGFHAADTSDLRHLNVSGVFNIREDNYDGSSFQSQATIITSGSAYTGGAGQTIYSNNSTPISGIRYGIVPDTNKGYTLGNPNRLWDKLYSRQINFDDGTTMTTAPETNPLVATKVYATRKSLALSIALGG